MKPLGVAIPAIDEAIGGDPAALREFAQAAEEIGYQDLAVPDHVLGVNVASRPGWGDRNTSADLFHDPFALFSFLAGCTKTIEFSTQVLILAQRQAVLVAKQAARSASRSSAGCSYRNGSPFTRRRSSISTSRGSRAGSGGPTGRREWRKC
jgi:alkanesulfonate monooxygenase SsuD/methylene tetrahydromethanopterin reductase-like flavin-dependent oxidoreductase (luciferase family)